MTRFEPYPEALNNLKDKVVVITGGASGIGAASVTLFHEHGARVIFGDVATKPGEDLQNRLGNGAHFVKCDVGKYSDNLLLFKTAREKYGHVDHAVANAGVPEIGNIIDPSLSLEGVEEEPNHVVLDINLKAVLNFARIAVAYLNDSRQSSKDKSLTLVSSVAGFIESPGLFAYEPAKSGVLGLMRALRCYLPEKFPELRVNAVCPWMTLTRMVAGIQDGWFKAGLPTNDPGDIARHIVGLAAACSGTRMLRYEPEEGDAGRGFNRGVLKWGEFEEASGVNGRAIYVEGGRGWDIEEGLDRTLDLWMGKGPSERLAKGQVELGIGAGWTSKE
ncbi:MAG: hypothetical protein Q9227_007167 [Pyrenula ochraceoflavens]